MTMTAAEKRALNTAFDTLFAALTTAQDAAEAVETAVNPVTRVPVRRRKYLQGCAAAAEKSHICDNPDCVWKALAPGGDIGLSFNAAVTEYVGPNGAGWELTAQATAADGALYQRRRQHGNEKYRDTVGWSLVVNSSQ